MTATTTPPIPPTPLAYPGGPATDTSHRLFLYLNRLMVPVHRAGLAAWLGSPFTGCQLLLRCRGRRSDRVREIPLGYLVSDGAVWVLAGYGRRTEWLRNIEADPRVELLLPAGRAFAGQAREETDPNVRARIAPALVRSMGVVGSIVGSLPWTASDERILDLLAGIPLIRIDPTREPIVAGPDDPGGLAWVWRQAAATLATVWLVRAVVRAIRRAGSPGS